MTRLKGIFAAMCAPFDDGGEHRRLRGKIAHGRRFGRVRGHGPAAISGTPTESGIIYHYEAIAGAIDITTPRHSNCGTT